SLAAARRSWVTCRRRGPCRPWSAARSGTASDPCSGRTRSPAPPPGRAARRRTCRAGSHLRSAAAFGSRFWLVPSHLLRGADADQRQPVGQRLADCGAEREARAAQLLVLDADALRIIVAVKLGREFAQVEGNVVRCRLACRLRHRLGKLVQQARQRRLALTLQPLELRRLERARIAAPLREHA